MAELQHFSHECKLASPEIFTYGVCNICYKDEPVEFACKSCKFDLCKTCSELPPTVYHEFHPDHLLEFCLGQYDRSPEYVVCSGCGNMFSGSFYECKECEIYLDLGCALLKNIVTSWDLREMLHYSHCHLVKRCRPGQDTKGCCLLCELPLYPSSICYGCVHCYSFLHERCLELPIEIQHPVHPAHPLRRLDYAHNCGVGRDCNACGDKIIGVPFGCLECNFDIHMRCADSLLRSLMHKSHEHRLFYVCGGMKSTYGRMPCEICMRGDWVYATYYYQCVECDSIFHFKCVDIPESVVKKSFHIHPLALKTFVAEKNSMEYCGVCETMVHAGHHAYTCQECDFVGHIGCILREEEPSPLYLKDLYSSGKVTMRSIDQKDSGTNNLENKLTVNDIWHIHVMKPVLMSDLDKYPCCKICGGKILSNPWKCETCSFETHHYCAELGRPSKHRLHQKHPLTLLPMYPSQEKMKCDICRENIYNFNLFCRICDFVIHINCALKSKHVLEALRQKFTGTWRGWCKKGVHNRLVQVMVSRSYPTTCVICDEKLCEKAVSCMTCEEIYHPQCIESYHT
ncbi:DC1 [Arabidopsis suecica]|uniref:DC1 n=1 Tax=Arabidopsis suecica TaxID=45249 RepID=A0A8T2ADZ6_ARASU|nr:DC1 [Arabidopsis suecica]